MCIDYRSLNQQIKINVFPIPHVADLFDCLGVAMAFSSMDLSHTIRCIYM